MSIIELQNTEAKTDIIKGKYRNIYFYIKYRNL